MNNRSRVVFAYCGALLLTYFAVGARFDDCRVAPGTSQVDLARLENNSPRKDEVIRSKAYFKTASPYISLYDSNHRVVFGEFVGVF